MTIRSVGGHRFGDGLVRPQDMTIAFRDFGCMLWLGCSVESYEILIEPIGREERLAIASRWRAHELNRNNNVLKDFSREWA
jgi:hypothetical protein